jgi:phosphatidylinositol kinase/protein kinase (PI-3  family)
LFQFGDCFEVAMMRDKFPEKVPFRLTRMLIQAMEVSGIEGSYRSTCERTMSVLRDSRDSLVAMLEAFVYDPLISWRLADLSPGATPDASNAHMTHGQSTGVMMVTNGHSNLSGVQIEMSAEGRSVLHGAISEHPDEDAEDADAADIQPIGNFGGLYTRCLANRSAASSAGAGSRARSLQMYSNIQSLAANLSTESRIASVTGGGSERVVTEGSIARSRIERSMRQRELLSYLEGEQGAAHEEALNGKALKVIRRVQDKLTGTDFACGIGEPVDVTDQVQRLIVQATSSENLCQLFVGWCAFW